AGCLQLGSVLSADGFVRLTIGPARAKVGSLNNKNNQARGTRVMKRVGIVVGREKTLPDELIKRVNERGVGEMTAEFIKLGGVRHDAPPRYDVVIDRISHEVPFYRATLKRMALEGATIINNPFWWSADDKFFNYSLAPKLGVAVPKTVLLPQKDYMTGIVSESLRNLEFPLDWQGIVDYVG